jgi:hypothetical protein
VLPVVVPMPVATSVPAAGVCTGNYQRKRHQYQGDLGEELHTSSLV